MLWFLRLFSAFRTLEAEHGAMRLRELTLEGKERWYQSQIDKAQAHNVRMIDEALTGAKLTADFMSQHSVGVPVYGIGPKIEPAPAPEPISEARFGRSVTSEYNSPESIMEVLRSMDAELVS